MARKKKPPPFIFRRRPGVTVNAPDQPGRPDSPIRILPGSPPGSILVASDDPVVDVIALANTSGVTPVEGGGARHRISERIWEKSVPQYEGHDPFRVSVSLILTGFSTRTRIDTQLEDLYLLGSLNADRTMPLIRLSGQVHARWARRTWTMDGHIQWDESPGILAIGDGHYQLPVTFTLLERVQDELLQHSISKSRKGSGAKNGPRFHTVRKGENDYGDVSKAEYGTRSRAAEIARANRDSVGAKLRVGQKLRLP